MMKKGRLIGYLSGIVLGLGVLMSSCSKDVQTQDFSQDGMQKYRSFAFIPSGDTATYRYVSDPLVAEGLRDEVTTQLKDKGLYLDAVNPDLLVLIHARYSEEIDFQSSIPSGYEYYAPGYNAEPWGGYYYTNYNGLGYIGPGPGVAPVEYTRGVVVVDLIDPETKKIVWRGKATDDIYNENRIYEEMAENVEDIFDEYPG